MSTVQQSSPSDGRPRRPRGRPRKYPQASPAVQSEPVSPEHADILNELSAANPAMPPERVSQRLTPMQWDKERKRMLIELLKEDGPDLFGDGLLEHLRKHPKDYSPAYLESYRRSRDAWDEIIAQQTKEQAQADVKHLEESIASEERYCPDSTVYIANLKAALATAKERLEQFDSDPVRFHAVARYQRRVAGKQTKESPEKLLFELREDVNDDQQDF